MHTNTDTCSQAWWYTRTCICIIHVYHMHKRTPHIRSIYIHILHQSVDVRIRFWISVMPLPLIHAQTRSSSQSLAHLVAVEKTIWSHQKHFIKLLAYFNTAFKAFIFILPTQEGPVTSTLHVQILNFWEMFGLGLDPQSLPPWDRPVLLKVVSPGWFWHGWSLTRIQGERELEWVKPITETDKQSNPKVERRPLIFLQHKGAFNWVTREDKLYFQPLFKQKDREKPTVFIRWEEGEVQEVFESQESWISHVMEKAWESLGFSPRMNVENGEYQVERPNGDSPQGRRIGDCSGTLPPWLLGLSERNHSRVEFRVLLYCHSANSEPVTLARTVELANVPTAFTFPFCCRSGHWEVSVQSGTPLPSLS